jgi:ABC-type multidrug transport system ATPase subunit
VKAIARQISIPHVERERRMRAALAFMGLANAADKQVRTYSGGMIRRLDFLDRRGLSQAETSPSEEELPDTTA